MHKTANIPTIHSFIFNREKDVTERANKRAGMPIPYHNALNPKRICMLTTTSCPKDGVHPSEHGNG